MRKSLSKYLIFLAFFLIGTCVLMVSRYNTNNSSISDNLNTQDTLGVAKTSQTKDNLSPVQAEQVGSSPESGATSRLKQVHDWLLAKSDPDYGGTQPADYPYDRGTYWNRILYSAFWEPDGNATEADVLIGKTFYSGSNNRVQKTGTAIDARTSPGAYYEQFVEYDDALESDYTGEESTWINTNSSSGNYVWYDTRTGLYWARSESNMLSNSFTISTCDFFSTVPRGDYGTSGTDPDCGSAINACAVLSLASTEGQSRKTDWYLPSYLELDRAYIDGIYNKTSSMPSFSLDLHSSSTCGGSNTCVLNITDGQSIATTGNHYVSCVRRD